MVLVDTSVWIRFLANRAPFAATLEALLRQGDVCGHDFVFGELLMGDKGGRTQLLRDYALMHQVPLVSQSEVAEFVRRRRLHGRGIGWVDTHLLASALVSHTRLWTADPRLGEVARELSVEYE